MFHSSIQAPMDTADWLKGLVQDQEPATMDSASSSPSGDIACGARPPPPPPPQMLERRLRPQHDQTLKCPRCDSAHTKFCYYNNYSLSQPRYFCKTCRRYWTKGGSLRNVPVGGGCRKTKRPGNKNNKPADLQLVPPLLHQYQPLSFQDLLPGADLQLSTAGLLPSPPPLSASAHFTSLASVASTRSFMTNFMDCKSSYGDMFGGREAHEDKFGPILISNNNSRAQLFGADQMAAYGGGGGGCYGGDTNAGFCTPGAFHGMSQLGFCVDGGHGATSSPMEPFQQRLAALPFGNGEDGGVEVKPGAGKQHMLAIEWQEQGCGDVGREAFGYSGNGAGMWGGVASGHGTSTASDHLL